MYSLLIIGYDPQSWNLAFSSVEQIFLNLKENFQKLENVQVYSSNFDSKILPIVDFVLVSIFSDTEFDFEKAKKITRAKKITTFIETPFYQADHSFILNPLVSTNSSSLIKLPYGDFLQTSKKQEKTILIDHYWEDFLNTDKDWTFKIQEWLGDLSDYKINRLLRFPEERKTLKEYEQPLEMSGYKEYLAKTENIENFIITHKESFGYGIIDMITRGTRVFSPPDLLNDFMVEELEIPIFHNKEELLGLINQPYDIEEMIKKREKCTKYSEVVKILDKQFREWL